MPGEFVGMAEEGGLIVPIGRWVLHAACQAARDWQRRFPLVRPLYIGVNLSLRQLQHPDLVQDVAGAVDAAGLAPADLVLELTESVLVLDDEATIQRLQSCARSASTWPSTTSAPATRPWPTCAACRSTPSSSPGPSSRG
jgi:EAL domain-containing protein (putative c-di-GMP-specific phosphodiesterase class I)